jgi:hypothetical protein
LIDRKDIIKQSEKRLLTVSDRDIFVQTQKALLIGTITGEAN